MKRKWLHYRLVFNTMVTMIVTIVLLASCSYSITLDEPTQKEASEDSYNIAIRISAGPQTGARGTCSEEYGLAIENRIDLNDLQILLFDTAGSLKEILYDDGDLSPLTSLADLGGGEYLLQTKLDSLKYDTDSRFEIIALTNWSKLCIEGEPHVFEPGVTTLDDIGRITFRMNPGDADESWIPSENSLIPMSGRLTATLRGYSTQYFNSAVPMELGTLRMVRAVAKIEVIDDSTEGVAEVKSVTLRRRNRIGLLLHSATAETSDQLTHITPNVPRNPDFSETPLKFKRQGNKFVAYVPEMENPLSLEGRGYLDVSIEYNDYTEHRFIAMAPHDTEGKPYIPTDGWPDVWKALLRNHIYRFTIFSIEADPNLNLTVDVQPFSSVTLTPLLGLERNEDGYIVVRNEEGIVVKYIRTDNSVLTMEEVNDWPDLGSFIGVFDDRKKVLIGYFPDGRSIIFNYQDESLQQLESWEMYYPSVSDRPSHLAEIFCYVDYYDAADSSDILKHKFTHTLFDDKCRVVKEYRYPTREAFEQRAESTEGRITLADFTGDLYGDKRITYYHEDGEIYCQLIVRGNNEEYVYENFITD